MVLLLTVCGGGFPEVNNGIKLPPKPKPWNVTTLIDGTAAGFNILHGIVQSGDTLYVTSGNLIRKLEYR